MDRGIPRLLAWLAGLRLLSWCSWNSMALASMPRSTSSSSVGSSSQSVHSLPAPTLNIDMADCAVGSFGGGLRCLSSAAADDDDWSSVPPRGSGDGHDGGGGEDDAASRFSWEGRLSIAALSICCCSCWRCCPEVAAAAAAVDARPPEVRRCCCFCPLMSCDCGPC